MIYEQALKHLDLAIRQDRDRFFKLADPLHFQPKYADHLGELATLKQQWRDITKLANYPNINFPLPLPEWFPKWQFMQIVKDKTINELIQEEKCYEKHKGGSDEETLKTSGVRSLENCRD